MALPFLRAHWGKIYFFAWSLGSIFRLISRQIPSGHYDIFISAPRLFFAGNSPYGISYESGSYVYSPLAALFYAPFSALPYFVGLTLLSLVSLAVFSWGLFSLMKATGLKGFWAEVFFFVLTSEIIGSLLNVRIEIFSIGLLMGATSMLISNPKNYWAWMAMAVLSNFKFQALAPTGLILGYLVIYKKSLVELCYFFGFSILALALPALVFGPSLTLRATQEWLHWLGFALDESFYTFQHIYAFFRNTFSIELSYSTTQKLSLLVALFLLAWVLLTARIKVPSVFLRAAALGSAFVCAFSPAAQSAAFILYAPLLIWMFLERPKNQNWVWVCCLMVAWFLVSLSYSDLVGQSARHFFFMKAVKPLGILALLFYLGRADWKKLNLVKA